jgi:hypothetical protein
MDIAKLLSRFGLEVGVVGNLKFVVVTRIVFGCSLPKIAGDAPHRLREEGDK